MFVSNVAGIFVAASFDAIRLLSLQEKARASTIPAVEASSSRQSANTSVKNNGGHVFFNLNFNLPLWGQEQQLSSSFDSETGSPYITMVGGGDPNESLSRRRSGNFVTTTASTTEARYAEKPAPAASSSYNEPPFAARTVLLRPMWKIVKSSAHLIWRMIACPVGNGLVWGRRLTARSWLAAKNRMPWSGASGSERGRPQRLSRAAAVVPPNSPAASVAVGGSSRTGTVAAQQQNKYRSSNSDGYNGYQQDGRKVSDAYAISRYIFLKGEISMLYDNSLFLQIKLIRWFIIECYYIQRYIYKKPPL